MAKHQQFAPTTHTLILRNADGEKINGTGSTGDLEHTRSFAQKILRTVPHVAYIDVYAYDPAVSWQSLQPLAMVTLDDE
jgi:hypothetical protein